MSPGSRTSMLEKIRRASAAGAPSSDQGPVPRAYHRAGSLAAGSEGVVELLTDRLVDYKAEVSRTSAEDLAAAVTRLLAGIGSVVIPVGLAKSVRDGLGASGATVTVDGDPDVLDAHRLDAIEAVVTCAAVAIAVTGTVILDGSPDQGRRAISLVPDRHLIVVRAEQIVESVPEGLALVRPTAPLTMISGPSATSDIELSRVEGVHGPRVLQVLIVG